MVAKTKKQTGKSPATQTDRDRSPLVSPPGKSNVRRPGREGKVFNSTHSNGLSGISHKLGLTPSAAAKLGITLLLGKYHLTQLFENDRHFSHLSNLEKEMAFRTEMGLYYSYYKTIIEAPSFLDGLHMVMNDRLTEHPLVINTLKRFNLYPEVILIFGKLPNQICLILSLHDGMGDPAYFYVACVFLLNGMMMSIFFMYGSYLSGSRLGGVITTLCFFFNHGEVSAVPLISLSGYSNVGALGSLTMVALGISNLCFMLPWQFAQFVLLTQVASLFASYILGYLAAAKMQSILVTHMITLGVCFVLMFGNSMLLTSFYASSLVSIWVIIAMRERFAQVFRQGIVIWVLKSFIIYALLTELNMQNLRIIFSQGGLNGLIKSKFTSYKDFHTLMYTCAAEFDFMELETPVRYLKTLLLPINVLVVALIAGRVSPLKTLAKTEDADEAMVYHSLQLVAFAVLAILIMRLKLFLTPHMCIMASLICSRQLFGWIGEKFKQHTVVFAVLAIMAIQGMTNLQAQWAIIGEFSNLPQEELLDWVQENTRPNAVFAGAMPTMASVKLSTGRPIVNHPHYEDAGLRERTKLVYSMYSRMSGETVKRNLMKLGVEFFILEDSWCTRRTRPGCSMPEIWDIEDPQNVGKTPLCTHISRNSRPHFTTVFSNDIYKVLKVPKATKDLR
uniref:Dpy-19-like 1, like (H. sapiens) n=1 Tax=Haplochromis burtoni TaxID=8153 RepID=A0A3Q2WV65_HAPBU